MIKKRYIILLAVLALITATIVFLYMEYKRQTKDNTEIDYPQQYEDETDINTKINPVSLNNGEIRFNLNNEKERLQNKSEEISMLIDCMPDDSINMKEIEKITNSEWDTIFEGYTVRLIGSGKTNQRYKGYHIQTQKKEQLAQTVHIILTPDNFLEELISAQKETILESKIDGVVCHVFYNHTRRTEKKSGEKTERYVYEAVFSYEQMYYYVKIDFSGFDYQLNMVETTENNTSKEVAEFLRQMISIIKK